MEGVFYDGFHDCYFGERLNPGGSVVIAAARTLAIVADGVCAAGIANMISTEFPIYYTNAHPALRVIWATLIIREGHHCSGARFAGEESMEASRDAARHGWNVVSFSEFTTLGLTAAEDALGFLDGELNRFHEIRISRLRTKRKRLFRFVKIILPMSA